MHNLWLQLSGQYKNNTNPNTNPPPLNLLTTPTMSTQPDTNENKVDNVKKDEIKANNNEMGVGEAVPTAVSVAATTEVAEISTSTTGVAGDNINNNSSANNSNNNNQNGNSSSSIESKMSDLNINFEKSDFHQSISNLSMASSSAGGSAKQSGLKPPSRIGRPCGGQQKPAVPSTPPTQNNSSDDSIRRMTDDFGRHRLTDLVEADESEEDGLDYLRSYRRKRYSSSIGGSTASSMDYLWDKFPRRLSEAGLSRHSDSSAILTEDTDSFMIGQRVWVGGNKPGKIAYIGETQFAPGEWAGVALDEPIGKNDGSVGGIKYFQCEPKKGVFSRLTRLTRVPIEQPGMGSNETFTYSTPSPTMSSSMIRKSPISPTGSSLLRTPASLTNSNTSLASTATTHVVDFKMGDRVIIKSTQGSKVGTVRFMGLTDFAPGEWVGVELDDPRGKNDGSVNGVRYFECRPNFGLFAPISKVSKSPSKVKPGSCVVHSGPGLPPSGLKRMDSKESMASMVSRNSVASSARRVRLGVTSLTSQKVPSKASTPLATRTALQDVLKEKQQHIEQLLKERDLERAEITKAAGQAEQAELKFNELKKEYEQYRSECQTKLQENLDVLKKLNVEKEDIFNALEEEKKKNEDWQFKFEEADIIKRDAEASNTVLQERLKELETSLATERAKREGSEQLGTRLFEAEENLVKARGEIDLLKSQLEEQRSKRELDTNDQIAKLQKDLDERQITIDKINEQYSNILENLQGKEKEITQLTTNLEEVKNELVSKITQVEECTNEKKLLETQIVDLTKLNENQTVSINDELQRVKHNLDEINKLHQEKDVKVVKLQDELNEKHEIVKRHANEIDELKGELMKVRTDSADERTRETRQIYMQHEKQIQLLQQEVLYKSEELVKSSIVITRLEEDICAKNSRIELLEQELEGLEKVYKENCAVNVNTNNEIDALKLANGDLLMQLQLANEHIAKLQEMIATLESEIVVMGQNGDKDAEIAILNQKLTACENEKQAILSEWSMKLQQCETNALDLAHQLAYIKSQSNLAEAALAEKLRITLANLAALEAKCRKSSEQLNIGRDENAMKLIQLEHLLSDKENQLMMLQTKCANNEDYYLNLIKKLEGDMGMPGGDSSDLINALQHEILDLTQKLQMQAVQIKQCDEQCRLFLEENSPDKIYLDQCQKTVDELKKVITEQQLEFEAKQNELFVVKQECQAGGLGIGSGGGAGGGGAFGIIGGNMPGKEHDIGELLAQLQFVQSKANQLELEVERQQELLNECALMKKQMEQLLYFAQFGKDLENQLKEKDNQYQQIMLAISSTQNERDQCMKMLKICEANQGMGGGIIGGGNFGPNDNGLAEINQMKFFLMNCTTVIEQQKIQIGDLELALAQCQMQLENSRVPDMGSSIVHLPGEGVRPPIYINTPDTTPGSFDFGGLSPFDIIKYLLSHYPGLANQLINLLLPDFDNNQIETICNQHDQQLQIFFNIELDQCRGNVARLETIIHDLEIQCANSGSSGGIGGNVMLPGGSNFGFGIPGYNPLFPGLSPFPGGSGNDGFRGESCDELWAINQKIQDENDKLRNQIKVIEIKFMQCENSLVTLQPGLGGNQIGADCSAYINKIAELENHINELVYQLSLIQIGSDGSMIDGGAGNRPDLIIPGGAIPDYENLINQLRLEIYNLQQQINGKDNELAQCHIEATIVAPTIDYPGMNGNCMLPQLPASLACLNYEQIEQVLNLNGYYPQDQISHFIQNLLVLFESRDQCSAASSMHIIPPGFDITGGQHCRMPNINIPMQCLDKNSFLQTILMNMGDLSPIEQNQWISTIGSVLDYGSQCFGNSNVNGINQNYCAALPYLPDLVQTPADFANIANIILPGCDLIDSNRFMLGLKALLEKYLQFNVNVIPGYNPNYPTQDIDLEEQCRQLILGGGLNVGDILGVGTNGGYPSYPSLPDMGNWGDVIDWINNLDKNRQPGDGNFVSWIHNVIDLAISNMNNGNYGAQCSYPKIAVPNLCVPLDVIFRESLVWNSAVPVSSAEFERDLQDLVAYLIRCESTNYPGAGDINGLMLGRFPALPYLTNCYNADQVASQIDFAQQIDAATFVEQFNELIAALKYCYGQSAGGANGIGATFLPACHLPNLESLMVCGNVDYALQSIDLQNYDQYEAMRFLTTLQQLVEAQRQCGESQIIMEWDKNGLLPGQQNEINSQIYEVMVAKFRDYSHMLCEYRQKICGINSALNKASAMLSNLVSTLGPCENCAFLHNDIDLIGQITPTISGQLGYLGGGNNVDFKCQQLISTKQKEAENQIEFLNSIIVDIQRKNEEQQARINALEAGYIGGDANDYRFDVRSKREVAPRMYCDICEEFDLHETEDCPTQNNEMEGVNLHKEKRDIPAARPYCELCEAFGHATENCTEEQTF